MCGIAGLIDRRTRWDPEARLHIAEVMADAIAHRGPDDAGTWAAPDDGLVLSHRRLSVVDLSPLGHQPMPSPGGRYVITYNGELYNFRELRHDLETRGVSFRSHSDTEVLLALVERFGVRGGIERTNGMFACAIWDREQHELHLTRDRMGEKPLYYVDRPDVFAFCSELKSLVASGVVPLTVDRGSVALYLRHAYVPAPRSIFEEVRKLPPATILTVRRDGSAATSTYWDVDGAAASRAGDGVDLATAADELEELLRASIAARMVADVPVGAFLSGGIDSSAVVALMQAESRMPVKTFCIGFREQAFDEAAHARRVAAHLGTEHAELFLSPHEARAVLPTLPAMYDEPFADPSALPTSMVAALARESVTVSLSGDGGDELFNGYDRYRRGARLERMWHAPGSVRRAAAGALRRAPGPVIDRTFSRVMKHPAERTRRLAAVLGQPGPESLYSSLIGYFQDPSLVLRDTPEPASYLTETSRWPAGPSFRDRMAMVDLVDYLPNDILVKVDRATMAVGLEARVPLLDHRLVEWAVALPMDAKAGRAGSKLVLREVLHRHVPRTLVDRPKMGFGVPVGEWVRGPLRAWGDDLLDRDRLVADGFLDADAVGALWHDHLAGTRDWSYHVWILLTFQAWMAWLRDASRIPDGAT